MPMMRQPIPGNQRERTAVAELDAIASGLVEVARDYREEAAAEASPDERRSLRDIAAMIREDARLTKRLASAIWKHRRDVTKGRDEIAAAWDAMDTDPRERITVNAPAAIAIITQLEAR